MGGLLVLLAVATTGVTYGWQPDGNGGVEYIVQVSPNELAQARHSGEITSTIDPSIRGHVSRVIVRVGTAELPRETPAQLTAHAQADHNPVSIPQIPSVGPNDRLADRRVANQVETVMKPDTGRGLDLPSLAGRAGEAVRNSQIPQNVGAAARDMASRATERLTERAKGTATSALDRMSNSLRGSAAEREQARVNQAARTNQTVRAGQPFSNSQAADPRDQQRTADSSWRDLARDRNVARTDARAPEMVGPPSPFRGSQNAADNNLSTSRRGFGGNSNFGSIPNARGTTELNYAKNRLNLNEQTRTPFSQDRESVRSQSSTLTLRDQQNRTDTRDRMSFGMDRTSNASPSNQQLTAPNFGGNTNYRANEALPTNRRDAGLASTNLAAQRLPGNRLDLSQSQYPQISGASAQLPAGYSRDRYGNVINAKGQIVDENGYPVSQQRAYELTIGRSNPALAALPTPGMTTRPTGMTQNPAYPTQTSQPPYVNAPAVNARSHMSIPNGNNNTHLAAASSPNHNTVSPSRTEINSQKTGRESGVGEVREPKKLLAQPLFNLLMLTSLCGNIYLIFWFQRMRHRFHEMVAAKRIATAESIMA